MDTTEPQQVVTDAPKDSRDVIPIIFGLIGGLSLLWGVVFFCMCYVCRKKKKDGGTSIEDRTHQKTNNNIIKQNNLTPVKTNRWASHLNEGLETVEEEEVTYAQPIKRNTSVKRTESGASKNTSLKRNSSNSSAKRNNSVQRNSSTKRNTVQRSSSSVSVRRNPSDAGKDNRKSLKAVTIDVRRVALHDTVSLGQYGIIHKGTLTDQDHDNPQTVIVKTVQEGSSQEEKDLLIEDVLPMRGFDHNNVMSLLGIAMLDSRPLVVFPFMSHGDLKTYVSDPNTFLTVKNLLEIALQVGEGMEYLSRNGFVHTDLATRNCIIDDTRLVKVGDAGLSRDLFWEDYYTQEEYKRPLPVRWMSPESFQSLTLTSQTDVWSYGVLIWELFTRGKTPYHRITNAVVVTFVQKGERLEKPPYAPDYVYDVMESCWKNDPESRPVFKDLCETVEALVHRKGTLRPSDSHNVSGTLTR